MARGTVITAAAMALVACTGSGEPQQETVTNQPSTPPAQSTDAVFPLPTSDWTPDDFAEQALLNATLYRDEDCLLAGPATAPTAVVWPKGFTAVESAKDVVSVVNAQGTVVALSGHGINVGGGYSSTEGDVTSEIISWLAPECAGKFEEVFVVQDSMTGQQAQDWGPRAGAILLDYLVTAPEELEGKWVAVELYGKDVKPRPDEKISMPYLVFAKDPAQAAKPATWSTNDGCNTIAGQYTVLPDGSFQAQDGWSTLVGCPPVWSLHGANIQAVTEADQAVILPSDSDTADAADRLLLLFRGETIGVYLAGPRPAP